MKKSFGVSETIAIGLVFNLSTALDVSDVLESQDIYGILVFDLYTLW